MCGDDILCHRCRRSSQLTRRYLRDGLPARYRQRSHVDVNEKSFILAFFAAEEALS